MTRTHEQWQTSRDAVPQGHVQITVYDSNTGNRIATVFEREEHAELVAAAPDLLAALLECVTDEGAHCLAYGTDTPAMRRRIAEINRIANAAIYMTRIDT
jgi:hypothetical protein